MDPSPESPSDGGLGIFVAQRAMYRRVVHQDFNELCKRSLPPVGDYFYRLSHFTPLNRKAELVFAPLVRRMLGARGEWIFFEPMLQGNETREEFLDRWKASLEHDWQEFTPEEKTTIWEHVSQYDFPENLGTFERIAFEGGFRSFEHLYTDPFCFYGAFRAMV